MVTPALQLAQKIPEVNIQLWGTALLRGELLLFACISRLWSLPVCMISIHHHLMSGPYHVPLIASWKLHT